MENPEKTHPAMGKTCQFHRQWSQPGIDFLSLIDITTMLNKMTLFKDPHIHTYIYIHVHITGYTITEWPNFNKYMLEDVPFTLRPQGEGEGWNHQSPQGNTSLYRGHGIGWDRSQVKPKESKCSSQVMSKKENGEGQGRSAGERSDWDALVGSSCTHSVSWGPWCARRCSRCFTSVDSLTS